MFLHLFCPCEINAAAGHNTMHPVSSAAFLLLFTINCMFRDMFIPLHFLVPHPTCPLVVSTRKILWYFDHPQDTHFSSTACCMAIFPLHLLNCRAVSQSLLSPLAVLGCHTSCSPPGSTSALHATTVRVKYYKRCNYLDKPFFLVHIRDARWWWLRTLFMFIVCKVYKRLFTEEEKNINKL